MLRDVWILIPAYKPDARLIELIDKLRASAYTRILVVDDGSGAQDAYPVLFQQARDAGAVVLTHETNRGKGAALKTGFRYILENAPMPVVTCDADGQHIPSDVDKLCLALEANPEAFVLGVRDFSVMPPRSKAGNTITRAVLGVMTGLWLKDTQTGLRAHPTGMLPMLTTLEGDRYEYEMHVLMEVRHARRPVVQIPIHTIYYDDNKGSHFNAVRDGFRIYKLLFGKISMYIGSSAVSGIVDFGLFTLLLYVLPNSDPAANAAFWVRAIAFLFPAGFGAAAFFARIASALVNYTINREVVFKSKAGKRSILFYYALVFGSLVLSVQIMRGLTWLGMHALPAKLLADATMFLVNYNMQQIIFRAGKDERPRTKSRDA